FAYLLAIKRWSDSKAGSKAALPAREEASFQGSRWLGTSLGASLPPVQCMRLNNRSWGDSVPSLDCLHFVGSRTYWLPCYYPGDLNPMTISSPVQVFSLITLLGFR